MMLVLGAAAATQVLQAGVLAKEGLRDGVLLRQKKRVDKQPKLLF